MNKLTLTSAVLTLIIMTGPLSAHDFERFSVGVHGGYSMGGDVSGSELAYGAQVEVGITKTFSLELAISRLEDRLGNNIDLDLTTAGLSAIKRHQLGRNGPRCYLLAGVNYNFISADSPDFDLNVENDRGLHLGGGLIFDLPDNWELFTEYRHTFLSATVNGDDGRRDEDMDFGLFKIGINYLY